MANHWNISIPAYGTSIQDINVWMASTPNQPKLIQWVQMAVGYAIRNDTNTIAVAQGMNSQEPDRSARLYFPAIRVTNSIPIRYANNEYPQ